MDVTIKLSFEDASILSAVLVRRKDMVAQCIARIKECGGVPPQYLYDDVEEKARLCAIIEGAMERVMQEDRARLAALLRRGNPDE